jgi:hypothetical protein
MFDNARERIRKLEETNETFRNVKQHVEKHKIAYIAGTTGFGCLVVGGIGGAALGKTDVKQVVDSMKLIHIQYKSPNVNLALVKEACPDPIPVLDKATGEAYRSINRASKMTGTTIRSISRDAQGVQERWERLPDSVFA